VEVVGGNTMDNQQIQLLKLKKATEFTPYELSMLMGCLDMLIGKGRMLCLSLSSLRTELSVILSEHDDG
jgi:hypothetical protein